MLNFIDELRIKKIIIFYLDNFQTQLELILIILIYKLGLLLSTVSFRF